MSVSWADLAPDAVPLPPAPPPHHLPGFPALRAHVRQATTQLPVPQIWTTPGQGAVLCCPCQPGLGVPVPQYYCPNAQRRLMAERRCVDCGEPADGPLVFLGVLGAGATTAPPLHPACARRVVEVFPRLRSLRNAVVFAAAGYALYEQRLTRITDGKPRYTYPRLGLDGNAGLGVLGLLVAVPDTQHPVPLNAWAGDQYGRGQSERVGGT